MLDDHPDFKTIVRALPFTFVGSVIVAIIFDWHQGGLPAAAGGVAALTVAAAIARALKTWMFDRAGVGSQSRDRDGDA